MLQTPSIINRRHWESYGQYNREDSAVWDRQSNSRSWGNAVYHSLNLEHSLSLNHAQKSLETSKQDEILAADEKNRKESLDWSDENRDLRPVSSLERQIQKSGSTSSQPPGYSDIASLLQGAEPNASQAQITQQAATAASQQSQLNCLPDVVTVCQSYKCASAIPNFNYFSHPERVPNPNAYTTHHIHPSLLPNADIVNQQGDNDSSSMLLTFDPATSIPEHELKLHPMTRKSKKTPVAEECKDSRYWKRRLKNNAAARRSREARRLKENQIALRARFLEKENAALKEEINNLRKELEMFGKFTKNNVLQDPTMS